MKPTHDLFGKPVLTFPDHALVMVKLASSVLVKLS
jgi:hypothetical protein